MVSLARNLWGFEGFPFEEDEESRMFGLLARSWSFQLSAGRPAPLKCQQMILSLVSKSDPLPTLRRLQLSKGGLCSLLDF